MKTRITIIFALIIILIVTQATILAQGPCTQQEASQKPGAWGKNADDLAMADATFPKAQYASVLKKADQAIALLRQAVPKLTGVEAKPYRSIRGAPYVKGGPVPFGVNVPVFDYYCIPLTSGDPGLRGQIRASGEAGTWIYFYFNSLGWLWQETDVGQTVNGAKIFVMPKQGGDLKGYQVLLPEKVVGRPDEAIIITLDGRLPYKPLSREAFLLAKQKYYQEEVAKAPKQSSVSTAWLTQRQSELSAIDNLLNSMSQAERQTQAIVRLPVNLRGKVFVTETEGGRPLVTVDGQWFNPTSSRTAIRVITVYLRVDRTNPVNSEVIRQFKNNFDFKALRQMLDN